MSTTDNGSGTGLTQEDLARHRAAAEKREAEEAKFVVNGVALNKAGDDKFIQTLNEVPVIVKIDPEKTLKITFYPQANQVGTKLRETVSKIGNIVQQLDGPMSETVTENGKPTMIIHGLAKGNTPAQWQKKIGEIANIVREPFRGFADAELARRSNPDRDLVTTF